VSSRFHAAKAVPGQHGIRRDRDHHDANIRIRGGVIDTYEKVQCGSLKRALGARLMRAHSEPHDPLGGESKPVPHGPQTLV